MFKAKDKNFTNEAAPYLGEYFMRQRFAKLGYTSNFDDLDSVTAEVFLAIDAEIESIKADAMNPKKAGR